MDDFDHACKQDFADKRNTDGTLSHLVLKLGLIWRDMHGRGMYFVSMQVPAKTIPTGLK